MAYGTDYTTALSNWNALPLNDRLGQIGITGSVDEGGNNRYYQNGELLRFDGSQVGPQSAEQAGQFDAAKYFTQQGILPLRPGWTDSSLMGMDDATARAYQDNWARSFNGPGGYNFGGYDDYLRNQTGPGQWENDPTLGQVWVPQNRDSNTWNYDTNGRTANNQAGPIGNLVNGFADNGGLVGALAGGIMAPAVGDLWSSFTGGWQPLGDAGGVSNAFTSSGMPSVPDIASENLMDPSLIANNGNSANYGWLDNVLNEGSTISTPGSGLPLGGGLNLPSGAPTPPVGNTDEFGNQIDNTGAVPKGTGMEDFIKQIFGSADNARLIGSLLSGGLGVLGSNQQANTLQGIADQNRAERQPFLSKATGYLNDPASYAAGPGAAAMKGVLNGLSVQGNPIGSGTALQFATDAGNKNWLNAVNSLGSLGLGGQGIQANLDSQAAASNGNMFNAIGSTINDIFSPKKSLAQTLAEYQNLLKA